MTLALAAPATATGTDTNVHHHLYRTDTTTTATVTDDRRKLVYTIEPVGLLAVLHTATGRVRTIVVGSHPNSLAIDEHSGRVYVANLNSDDVTVVRRERVLATVPVGASSAPNRVLVDPHTHLIYVTDTGADRVSVLRGTREIRRLEVGKAPSGLTQLGNRVYVANAGSGSLSVIRNERVVDTIAIGGTPTALSANPRTRQVYAVDPINSTVLMVRHGKLSATIALRTAATPIALVISPQTDTIDIIEAGSYDPTTQRWVEGGLAIISDRTIVADPATDARHPVTGLALDANSGQVIVGSNRAPRGFVLDGATVVATGGARFSGVTEGFHRTAYAGNAQTLGDPGITRLRIPKDAPAAHH
ncbi:MAG: YncE family protein [Frankiaceae bacterium]|nr:YncE family protein [Frankiaceae bacterium]